MAAARNPNKDEQPSTYFVQDRSNQEELTRVDEQDQIYTTLMGGVLSEQDDPTRFRHVLDVACGTGSWLVQTARTYPTIEELQGVDISARMIEHARRQATAARVDDRVHFQTGDALQTLPFPGEAFDLINQRLGMSFLRTWEWPKVLWEYQRVCQVGGVIRITESSLPANSAFPASFRLVNLLREAFYRAGHLFSNDAEGVISHFADQMSKYGIEDVQTRRYAFTLTATSHPEIHGALVKDAHRTYLTAMPFIRKWATLPPNYDDLYQQMVQETRQPGYGGPWEVVTAWGVKRDPRMGTRGDQSDT